MSEDERIEELLARLSAQAQSNDKPKPDTDDDDDPRERLAPRCAGCKRPLSGAGWLVLLGIYGQPAYFFCPECEETRAEWIDRQLGDEGEEAGCTGMVRLESDKPAEVLGMIRDIPNADEEEMES